MSDTLELQNLHYRYGSVHALKGVNIQVKSGEIVALLGSNGAGKTTTLWCISGLLGKITRGKITFLGEDISGKRPEKISAGGIGHVLEGRHVFPKLSVKENLLMGFFGKGKHSFSERLNYIYELFPRLKERESQEGGTLSGGEQQMLAVGRSLMSEPKFLLMDEPSLGLAPLIVKEIFSIITKINKNGTTILLVEQNSKAALQIAHRGYVMVNGEITLSGTASSLLSDENVRKSYLGEE